MTYNGWTNYETWNISLWLNNDEGIYNHCYELAEQAKETDDPKPFLADALKDLIDEGNPLADQANLYTDLLGAAISNANWFEIADGFLEE